MTPTTDPWLLRPATDHDAGAVLALFEANDVVEFGRVEMDLSDVAEVLEDDGRTWIASNPDGAVVGFAHVQRNGYCDTVAADVALRTHLVQLVIDTGRELGATTLEHWAGRGTLTAALLHPFGFRHTRTSWNLSKELTDLDSPLWPESVELRPFDDGAVEQVWALIRRAFEGTAFSRERTLDEWNKQILREADVIGAWEGGVLVGCATHEIRFAAGYIGQLAVDTDQRGRGLARALLHEAFQRDLARGLSMTKLNVDGANDSARRLYEGVGMTVEQEYRKWELEL